MSCSDVFLGLIAILFPPIAVWIKAGLCSADSFINLLLCMLGYLPGLIHAWYIIAKYPESDYEPIPDSESGTARVTYYYVDVGGSQQQRQQRQQGYGTNATGAPAKAGRPQQQRLPGQQEGQSVGGTAAGASSSATASVPPPPSYSEAVAGDHKVQT